MKQEEYEKEVEALNPQVVSLVNQIPLIMTYRARVNLINQIENLLRTEGININIQGEENESNHTE